MIQVIILFKEIFKGLEDDRKDFYYLIDEEKKNY